jgi:holo-[acyl-carrier protein] synthase
MAILGHGIDLVATARIAAMLDRHGDHFIQRVFTERERSYCRANPRRRAEHYAARFAAKEAVFKAIGTGWRDGTTWTDVEVTRRPSGEPGLKICGRTRQIADAMQVTHWHVSLSHTDDLAIASVIAEGTRK